MNLLRSVQEPERKEAVDDVLDVPENVPSTGLRCEPKITLARLLDDIQKSRV